MPFNVKYEEGQQVLYDRIQQNHMTIYFLILFILIISYIDVKFKHVGNDYYMPIKKLFSIFERNFLTL